MRNVVVLTLILMLGGTVKAQSIVVSTEEVSTIENALLVDARPAKDFVAGHIPGAANLDVDSLSETRDGVIGMLRLHDDLLPRFAAAGLAPDRTLVVYSGLEDASGVKQATRLFWVLEHSGYATVRLLDGGLAKWKAEGRTVETGHGTVAPLANIESLSALKPLASRVVDKKQLTSTIDHGTGAVLDLRSKDDYTGATKKDFVKNAGHIPGAKSKPATSFVEGEHFTFKSPELIRAMLGEAAQGGDKPVITYCNSGRDATVGYVACRIAGVKEVAVYDGSMAEWGNDAACPVADGDE